MQSFSDLPQTLAAALSAKGYTRLTQVQTAVTDPALSAKDLLVSAQTGSGKTVGFGLAMAPDLLDNKGRFERASTPLAVVIAPTRELALQVRREFDWLFAEAGIVTASAVGGMDARTERRAIERGVHVIAATPGRLRDHIAKGVIDLSDLRAVVLDEADEMLDMGFAEDLEFILDQTPATKRTLLFSATLPKGIVKLARTYQKDDTERLEIGMQEAQHSDISYEALSVVSSEIEKSIINVLRYHEAHTAIVFANTRAVVARLTAKLSNRGFSVVSLSGELSQTERTHAIQSLRDKRARVCVATDVAARGIDLPGLDLVVHADLPSNAETLLHRSGRTGRAGRKGTSVLIVPDRQRNKAIRLLKTAKLTAEWGAPPTAEAVLARDEARILSDTTWSDPLSVEETAFAEKLLATRSAEEIAAGYLRLYHARNCAPEILTSPGKKAERKTKEPRAFGSSIWFSLSLGRKQRAEPRWLLPMICRNAGISKSAIGAIRVQFQETFVEVLAEAVPGMKAELGEALKLEQGARLTELQGVPDFDASATGPPSSPKAPREGTRDTEPTPKPRREKPPQKPATKPERTAEDKADKSSTKPPKKPFKKRDGGKPTERAGHKGAKPHKRTEKPSQRDASQKPNRDAPPKGKSKKPTRSPKADGRSPRSTKGGDARPFRKR